MSSDLESLSEQLIAGNRRALAQAITLVESSRSDHRELGIQLVEKLIPYSGKSIRLGITGVPGVGKSTFIETLGNHLIDIGFRVAVLTVDPTSELTGGSILGDKTRMERLSHREEAFIRPSSSGTTLGGVTNRSRETVVLCEAAGYDVIMVETVGVGQSETFVAEITDTFILLLLPGSGDELQGIKRGIMELADIILINKADDELSRIAERARTAFESASRLYHHDNSSKWKVPVMTCSSRDNLGLKEAWELILRHQEMIKESGICEARRAEQAVNWMYNELENLLTEKFFNDRLVKFQLPEIESLINEGKIAPVSAAHKLLNIFINSIKDRD